MNQFYRAETVEPVTDLDTDNTEHELELVPVGVPAKAKAEAVAKHQELSPELTPPPTLSHVSITEAKAYLTKDLEWNQTGKEFLTELEAHLGDFAKKYEGKRYIPKTGLLEKEIATYVASLHSESSTILSYERRAQVKSAIAGAVNCGLLIPYDAPAEYPDTGVAKFYAFNQAKEAIALLASETLTADVTFNEELAEALITDSPLTQNPQSPLRLELTSKAFYAYFQEPRTLSETYLEKQFYKNNNSKSFTPDVRQLIDYWIGEGCKAGILINLAGTPPKYVLHPEARGSCLSE